MRRAFGIAAALIGRMALLLLVLFCAVYFVGTNDDLYYRLQMRADILPEAGISAQTLREADAMLSRCLRGEKDALSPELFNEREQTHMEDCRKLFLLLKTAMAIALTVAVLGEAAAHFLLNKKARRRCALAAPLLLLLPLGAFALWAVADFNAAFTFFHKVLFRNDLWLLDPATDLLIRLCPESMFATMGAIIASVALGFGIIVTVCTTKRAG